MEFVLKCLFFAVFICDQAHAVIYRLNESEYARTPPLYHVDKYDSCVDSGGKYCTVSVVIIPDTTSELFNLIQNYSEHRIKHFNHTKLIYGICVTKTCQNYMQGAEVDLNKNLEECLNDSFWKEYKLQAKIIPEEVHCYTKDDKMDIYGGDIIVAAICLLLLVLNVVGSLYDFFCKKFEGGNRFLLCFSIKKNWASLMAPRAAGLEPRQTRLKGLNGMRTISAALVICLHSMIPMVISTDNPRYMEEVFHHPVAFVFILHGTFVVQTFFIISAFLVAFNNQLRKEKTQMTWRMFTISVVYRWLKLTSSYAVMLAVTATWMRFAGSGPCWQNAVVLESQDCQRYWWQNLLYITNYVDYSRCMPQMWYLSSDLQLHVIGLAVCMLSGVWRKTALILMLIAGLAASGFTTYWHDLDGTIIFSPESCRNFFLMDPTFNMLYKRGHTNITCYAMGLMLGLAVYSWQKTDFKFHKLIKYRAIYYASFPLILVVVSVSYVFYLDGPRQPMYLRILYAVLNKPAFAVLIGIIIVGMVFKYEDHYRGILEHRGWTVPSRVSYATYVIHLAVIRYSIGIKTTLTRVGIFSSIEIFVSSVVITFALAIPFWLMVEAPLERLIKMYVKKDTTQRGEVGNKSMKEARKEH